MLRHTMFAVALVTILVSCGGGTSGVGERDFAGDWIETEFTGQFPDGVTIEEEGDHYVWIDDDGSFIARIDDNGDLIIDAGFGEATAVLVNGELIVRFLGEEARLRRQTDDDVATAAAPDAPAPCSVISTVALAETLGDDKYLTPTEIESSCEFLDLVSNDLSVTVEASSLAEWQAAWANQCEAHAETPFEYGILCVEPVSGGTDTNWTGAYWGDGLAITVSTNFPAGLSRDAFHSILETISIDGPGSGSSAPSATTTTESAAASEPGGPVDVSEGGLPIYDIREGDRPNWEADRVDGENHLWLAPLPFDESFACEGEDSLRTCTKAVEFPADTPFSAADKITAVGTEDVYDVVRFGEVYSGLDVDGEIAEPTNEYFVVGLNWLVERTWWYDFEEGLPSGTHVFTTIRFRDGRPTTTSIVTVEFS